MEKTAAIVVTYNRKCLLEENICSLLHQSPKVPDIIVVDNNSTDGTKNIVEKYLNTGKVFYYNTGKNLGGAGGFQYGIRKAVEENYDYLWIMDDDCIPEKNSLEKLFEYDRLLDGNYGFLSSKVLWKDGSICRMNIQRCSLTKNISNFDSKLIGAAMASFVSLFVKRSVVEDVGLPIKEFFIWTDDWEYTRRISRKYPCYVATESVVIHKSNSNISADISNDSLDRLERYKYLYRNDVYLYRREGLKGFCYEVLRLSLHIIRVLFKAKNNKWKRIKMIVGGTKNGVGFNPQIEYVNKEQLQ